MKCENCGNEVREGAKFCSKCGSNILEQQEDHSGKHNVHETKTEKRCVNCGNVLREESKFCPKCGSSTLEQKEDVSTLKDEEKDKAEQSKGTFYFEKVKMIGRLRYKIIRTEVSNNEERLEISQKIHRFLRKEKENHLEIKLSEIGSMELKTKMDFWDTLYAALFGVMFLMNITDVAWLLLMESQMELNVLSGNADSGKVYSRAKFDPIKAEAEAKLAQESTTKEELEAVFQQLEQFKMEFQDELGTGVYVSDLTHLSGNTAWGGVKKDLCPDGNRLIAIKKDTSTINTYTKGIGAHEPSSIVYDVTGYKMFSADIGVENHQIASDGGVFANVKAKFKVSTSTDGSNYTQQYYAEDLSANGGLRSIRVKLPEGTTHMKLECPASAWNNGNGGKLHTCWANAKLYETVEIAVTGITLDQDALALKVGGTEEQKTATLQAAITPEDATDQEVLWESDNEEVATVDGGVVTAHKAGNATIKVSSVNYPNITAQCIVTVTRDDTALEEAIAAAESRMKEENFAEKYTEATRKALEDDLADAKAAKDNTALSVEEVKLIVESLKTSIEGLQLKAVVTINNNGNTETKYCEVGDQVRVVAAQAPEGKKFSHWTVNEKPICYNESYTFTVYKDIAVTSVYVEEAEEIQKEVSVLCDVSYANGRVKFLSKYSIPTDADYKVIKAGVVATDSTGYAAIQEVQQELTLDTTATTRLKKYGVNTDLYLANFTQYLKTSRTTTWYARGYVTYQDNSGEQHTVYSDMAQYTIR